MKYNQYTFALLSTVAVGFGVAQAQLVNIRTLPGVTATEPYRITQPLTLEAGTDYLLDADIYVDGGPLTIDPGVIVAADGGALIVARGSQIFAEGNADEPIIITSLKDYNHIQDPTNPPAEIGFDNEAWGGVIILGRAPINFYVSGNPFTGATEGNTNRGENEIEGIVAAEEGIENDLIQYGQENVFDEGTGLLIPGTPDPDDNSGVFKYVSLRFGGRVVGLDDEINGLTMGGVGRGTTIEYVEVINNSDDGFEWFGGTVNCKYLVSFANEDEDFDIDEGFSGIIQFAFGLRLDELDGANNVENGSELDGGNGSFKDGPPFTNFQMWNSTYIGAGRVGLVANVGNVFRMKDNFQGQYHNSVFDDFGGNLVRIDDTSTAARVGNELLINNSHWGRYNGTIGEGQVAAAEALVAQTGNSTPGIDPDLGGISRLPDGGLDPRPNASSPLYGNPVTEAPAGVIPVNYRGAFGATNWARGWTYLDEAGYFGDLADVPAPTFVDTDGDGIDDNLEMTPALVALGFTVGVDDSNLFASLFTEESILDLVTGNQVMIQGGGAGQPVTLSLPLFRSNDLSAFGPAPALEATFNGTGEAEFYRIQVPAAE